MANLSDVLSGNNFDSIVTYYIIRHSFALMKSLQEHGLLVKRDCKIMTTNLATEKTLFQEDEPFAKWAGYFRLKAIFESLKFSAGRDAVLYLDG